MFHFVSFHLDTKNSVGLVGCIEEVSHNAIAVYWNPLESSAKVINLQTQFLIHTLFFLSFRAPTRSTFEAWIIWTKIRNKKKWTKQNEEGKGNEAQKNYIYLFKNVMTILLSILNGICSHKRIIISIQLSDCTLGKSICSIYVLCLRSVHISHAQFWISINVNPNFN